MWQGTGSWWWYFIRSVGKAYVRLQFSQELVNWRLWKPNIPFTHCNHAIINYIPQWRDSERRTKSTRWLRRIPKPPSQSLGNMNRSAALWQQWSCDHSTWLRFAWLFVWFEYSLLPQLSVFCSHVQETKGAGKLHSQYSWHLFILGSTYFQLYHSIFTIRENIIKYNKQNVEFVNGY